MVESKLAEEMIEQWVKCDATLKLHLFFILWLIFLRARTLIVSR